MSCQQRGRETRDTVPINNNSASTELIRWIRCAAAASMSEKWGNVLLSLNSSVLQGLCVVIRRLFCDSRKHSNQVNQTEGVWLLCLPHEDILSPVQRNTRRLFLSKQRGEVRARYGEKLARCLTHLFVVRSLLCFLEQKNKYASCPYLQAPQTVSLLVLKALSTAVHTYTVVCCCGSQKPLFPFDHDGSTLSTSSGQLEKRTLSDQKCMELQVSQNLSPLAAPRDSPARPASTTRATPRWTATTAVPIHRDSARGPLNWARLVAPRKVSLPFCLVLVHFQIQPGNFQ